jgi:hypothetical protein
MQKLFHGNQESSVVQCTPVECYVVIHQCHLIIYLLILFFQVDHKCRGSRYDFSPSRFSSVFGFVRLQSVVRVVRTISPLSSRHH